MGSQDENVYPSHEDAKNTEYVRQNFIGKNLLEVKGSQSLMYENNPMTAGKIQSDPQVYGNEFDTGKYGGNGSTTDSEIQTILSLSIK